ncbi:phosphoglycolate phosphatase [Pacificoceanicola onchidii]|uniref:phosphoglycolate phosphatase n=1 Tax=Pacificoceanicola onchidii TaxID=2562685 RepID=UPI0010A4F78D|nr:phosphoglycolate phosphatase [Pacificoceanicola onchidii]
MPGAIVFDLDGTLIDTAPDIHAAANRMLADAGSDPIDLATAISFVGHGIPNFVRQAMAHCGLDPAREEEWRASMLAHYTAHPADLSAPFPGVVTALEQLKGAGYSLGVCTNKPHAPSLQILDLLDLTRFFDVVIGGDSLAVKKPDPAPLHASFDALPGQPVLYVGDSEVDAETAVRAKTPFALFERGYRKTAVADMPSTVSFDDFHALPGIVQGLGQRVSGLA